MVQPAEHLVYAIHDYEIPGKGFLPLKAGDVLYVVDADASGWWLGVNLRRQKGVFPSTYTLPYVFPQPSAGLQRDAQLLLLARDFHVDLASGSPAPLHALTAAPPSSAQISASADALRTELQGLLLTRETARKSVMDELVQLLDLWEQQRLQQKRAAAAQKAEEDERATKRQRLQKIREELQVAVNALEAQKQAVLAKGTTPSSTWYGLFADVVSASAAGADTAATTNADEAQIREGVWRTALRDVKSVVQRQEVQLAALSSSCAAKEAAFTNAATELQARIEWRDSNVAAMLAYWAETAARIKSTYISCKTEREAALVAAQQEAAQLRHRLEEGRERFAEAKKAYRKLKREAHSISDLLKQQSTLEALSAEIAQADREIAARQGFA